MKPRQAMWSVIFAVAILAAPAASSGQEPPRVYRIGWLWSNRSETDPRVCWRKVSSFRQAWTEAMQDRGYTLGQNLTIECRYTEGQEERAIPFVSELVKLKPDLIIAAGTNQVRAAKQATESIPILMHDVIEPVRRGLVASLAHPGGNVTGVSDSVGVGIFGKYLQLLREAVPAASRVAALRYSAALREAAWESEANKEMETEARARGVALQFYYIKGREELDDAFAAMTKARSDALLVVPHPFFAVHARRIVDLAAQNRLPAMYPDKVQVEIGGLMAYAVDPRDLGRRVADYTDRILKGAKPGDLPVEQPTKFMLILNLKTAKALGLTFPSTFLLQADEVIR